MPLNIGENSYIDQTGADAYFADKLPRGWVSAADLIEDENGSLALTKRVSAALIAATAAVDQLGFVGTITRRDQALAWPRMGIRDREGRPVPSDAVPDAVRAAACEFALHLLETPGTPTPALVRQRIGESEAEFRATVPDLVPPRVRELLGPWFRHSLHSAEIVP